MPGSAVDWAVKRVEASLDEAEDAPPQAAKALWAVARGPVGQTTARGVTAAALVTVKAGTTALKARRSSSSFLPSVDRACMQCH